MARLDPSTTTWCGSANGPPEEIGLLESVQGGAADGRAGRLDAADMAQLEAVGQAGVQAGMDEGPATHVLRLLLEPDHLGGLGVALEGAGDLLHRPWVELLDPDDGHLGGRCLVQLGPVGQSLMGDLPAAQNDAPHRVGIDGSLVVENEAEGPRLELVQCRT